MIRKACRNEEYVFCYAFLDIFMIRKACKNKEYAHFWEKAGIRTECGFGKILYTGFHGIVLWVSDAHCQM